MNAINFIKHYGLNTAIRIIEDSKNDEFWDTGTGFYTDKNSESCVCLSELKRLVESVYHIGDSTTWATATCVGMVEQVNPAATLLKRIQAMVAA